MDLLKQKFDIETDHEHKCNQVMRKKEWPYVQRCPRQAIGLLNSDIVDRFELDRPSICLMHASDLIVEIEQTADSEIEEAEDS
jgi:hypothetical protein